jgi:acyl-CoA thioesterase
MTFFVGLFVFQRLYKFCDAVPSQTVTKKAIASGSLNKNAIVSQEDLPPMPAESRVEELFEQCLQELGISEGAQYEQMKKKSSKEKWMMICQQRAAKQEQKVGAVDKKPQYWVNKVSTEPTVATLNNLNFRLSTSSNFINTDNHTMDEKLTSHSCIHLIFRS